MGINFNRLKNLLFRFFRPYPRTFLFTQWIEWYWTGQVARFEDDRWTKGITEWKFRYVLMGEVEEDY